MAKKKKVKEEAVETVESVVKPAVKKPAKKKVAEEKKEDVVFNEGDLVSHPTLGPGIVEKVYPDKRRADVAFKFPIGMEFGMSWTVLKKREGKGERTYAGKMTAAEIAEKDSWN